MTQRNSFLPSIKGGRLSSSSKAAVISSQKQRYATGLMWKNPSLKYAWENQRNGRKQQLAQLPNRSQLFRSYDYSTPKTSEITTTFHINDFVQNYVHKRELELPPVKRQQSSLVKEKVGTQECCYANKKMLKEVSSLPLEFTEDVIHFRADPSLSSYFSADMKDLYNFKDLSISTKQPRNKDKLKGNSKRIVPQRHKLCMPDDKSKEMKIPQKSKYTWRKETEENALTYQVGKSTHLWEKYVLGLISKQTAQWIANQCSTGEQRGRLIGYLDEKYEIKDLEKDGTATVNKILSVHDDIISLPKKEKCVSQAEPEILNNGAQNKED